MPVKWGKGMKPRVVLDDVTQGRVDWKPLPTVYDHLVFPGFTYQIAAGESNLLNNLIAAFPDERQAIESYFVDVKRAQDWYRKFLLATLENGEQIQLQRLLHDKDSQLVLGRTGEYLQQRFKNPRLRAVVSGQWGDYGVAPADSAFLAHANVVSHYRYGGWYPVGGSACIAEEIIPIIEARGGQVLLKHEVEEILLENGKAVGVRVVGHTHEFKGPRYIYADTIISNVGAYNTYTRLIHASFCAVSMTWRVFQSMSTVTAYIGLSVHQKSWVPGRKFMAVFLLRS